MCPHQNGDSLATVTDTSEMIAVPMSNDNVKGKRGTAARGNGVNGHANHLDQPRRNPYAPRASDFLSNISNFNIIESTLRGSSQYTTLTNSN